MKKNYRLLLLAVTFLMMVFISMNALAEETEDIAGLVLEDGEYSIELEMFGGSGKASISSPALMYVEDGNAWIRLVWSSSNYDYMIVDGQKYMNENDEGYSTFHIPITVFDKKTKVIADTLAMGTPHEIEYTLIFYSESIGAKSDLPQEAAKRVVLIALLIIVGGGILNHFVNKGRY